MISVFLPLLIKCFLAWVGTGEYWQPHLNSSGSLLKWPKKVYLLEYKLFQHPACKTLKGKWWAGRRKLVNGRPQMRGWESPKWGEGKAPNEGKGKPKLEEGRCIESEKRKTNSGTKTKEIQLKNAEIGMPKWGEGKAQTGGREKSSCTAAPSGLMLGSSMKRSEFTCWRYQLCALFSTFNENFCHNLPWKENSPVLGPSFSRPSSQEGRGTWLGRCRV